MDQGLGNGFIQMKNEQTYFTQLIAFMMDKHYLVLCCSSAKGSKTADAHDFCKSNQGMS